MSFLRLVISFSKFEDIREALRLILLNIVRGDSARELFYFDFLLLNLVFEIYVFCYQSLVAFVLLQEVLLEVLGVLISGNVIGSFSLKVLLKFVILKL